MYCWRHVEDRPLLLAGVLTLTDGKHAKTTSSTQATAERCPSGGTRCLAMLC